MIELIPAILAIGLLLFGTAYVARAIKEHGRQVGWFTLLFVMVLLIAWQAHLILESWDTGHPTLTHTAHALTGLALAIAAFFWARRLISDARREIVVRKSLSESETAWRLLFEKSSDAVFILNGDNRIAEANDRGCALLGYTREQLLQLHAVDLFQPDRRSELAGELQAARAGDARLHERRIARFDGNVIIAEISTAPLPDGRLIATLRDVTQRKQAEEALKKSSFRLAQAAKLTRIGYFTWDISSDGITASDEIYQLIDLPVGTDLRSKDLFVRTYPDDVPEIHRALSRAIADNGQFEVEYRARLLDNATRFLHAVGQVSVDSQGNPVSVLVAVQDITDQKYAEQVLKESEDRFRRLYTETPAMMYSIDRDGRVVNVNRTWLETLGFTENEVLGHDSSEFMTEQSRRFTLTVVRPDFLKGGVCHDLPFQFVCKDGRVLDVLLSGITELSADGRPAQALVVLRDITAQRKAEAALLEERNLFLGGPTVVFNQTFKSGDLRIEYISPNVVALLGHSQQSMMESPEFAFGLIHPDDVSRFNQHIAQVLASRDAGAEQEYRLRKADGEYCWVHEYVRLSRNSEGKADFCPRLSDGHHSAETGRNEIARKQGTL